MLAALGILLNTIGSIILVWAEWQTLRVPVDERLMFGDDNERLAKIRLMAAGFISLAAGNALQFAAAVFS